MNKLGENLLKMLNKTDKSTWEVLKFGDFARNISERVEPQSTDASIYIGLEHLDPDSIHIRRFGKPSDVKGTKLKVYKGDIIFGKRRAYQRKAAVAEFDGICSAHAMVLRANPAQIDPGYFPFFIHSDSFMNRAIEISEGSLSPTIKWNILKEQEFRIPPRSFQEKLSEILNKIDDLENKYHQQISLLQQTEKVVANKLISRPSEKESISLADLVDIKKGITYSTEDYVEPTKGIPMINLNCFEKFGGFNREGVKFFGGKYQEKDIVSAGDIVIAITDITRNGDVVGYPVLVPSIGEKVVMSMDCCKLSPKNNLDSLFLYFLLKTDWVHRHFYTHSRGTTVLHLDLKSISKLRITPLSIERQRGIASKLKGFEASISKVEILIAKVRELRRGLVDHNL
jgi:type I restriction enzyme S subunit